MCKDILRRPQMLEWSYSVIREKRFHPDTGKYHTYAMKITGPDYSSIIHDVSPCEETAIRMAELFNKHQLLPAHFRDVLEDMLSL